MVREMRKAGCLTGILTGCFLLLLTVILAAAAIRSSFGDTFGKMSKEDAQADVSAFFDKNRDSLNSAADTVCGQASEKDVSVKGVETILYSFENGTDRVVFVLGSCGMLGGQEWGLIYAPESLSVNPDTTAKDGAREWHEADGNNYLYTERITDGWFFFFFDYDHE